MKTPFTRLSWFRLLAAWTAIGALTFPPPPAIAAESHETFTESLIEKTKQLQDRMSDLFRDSWKELRNSVEGKAHSRHSLATASVDVREQNEGYTVRISLPGRDIDKVEVSMTGENRLRVFAPANDKSGPYEQIVVLDGVAPGSKPDVVRNSAENLIVVRLTKNPVVAESPPETGKSSPKPLSAPLDRWDREILDHMAHMRREMDEMFQKSVEDFGTVPGLENLFDRSRFGSSFELQEENGNYVVHTYLPDRDAANVKVTVDDGTILKIEAEAEESSGGGDGAMVMKRHSQYSQSLTLPGPVDAEQLKVDRKDGMLVITVPKKTAD